MVKINIIKENDKVLVSSKEVAKNFDRNHSSIVKSIDSLLRNDESLKDCFIEKKFLHSINKRVFRQFLMTEKGFNSVANRLTKKNPTLENEYSQAFKKQGNIETDDFTDSYKSIKVIKKFDVTMFEVYSVGVAIGLKKERIDLLLRNSNINPVRLDNEKYFTKNDLLAFIELARTSHCKGLKDWLEGNTLESNQKALEMTIESQKDTDEEILAKALLIAKNIIAKQNSQINSIQKDVDELHNAFENFYKNYKK